MWFEPIDDFADLCLPRSRCSATCTTLFVLHYVVYTISSGGHVSRFAIGSRSIEVSISKVSTLLTFTTPRHILVSSPLWFLSIYLCFSCFMKFYFAVNTVGLLIEGIIAHGLSLFPGSCRAVDLCHSLCRCCFLLVMQVWFFFVFFVYSWFIIDLYCM